MPITSSETPKSPEGHKENKPYTLSPKWMSEVRQRLKKLKGANLSKEAEEKRAQVALVMRDRWLQLLAGKDGYLTDKEWRGLDNQDVAWGEMVGRCSCCERE